MAGGGETPLLPAKRSQRQEWQSRSFLSDSAWEKARQREGFPGFRVTANGSPRSNGRAPAEPPTRTSGAKLFKPSVDAAFLCCEERLPRTLLQNDPPLLQQLPYMLTLQSCSQPR